MSIGFVSVIIAVVIGLVVQWLASRIKTAPPKNEHEKSGTIAPEKISAWVTMMFGSAIMIGSTASLFFLSSSVVGSGMSIVGILAGGAMAGFMAPSVTSLHVLNWNENGVEGPSETFGPTLGRARTEIAWGDIIRTGETATQYWFIETNDGRRIYWSYLYKGHEYLNRYCFIIVRS